MIDVVTTHGTIELLGKGPKGDQGIPGEPGPPGEPGDAGPPGDPNLFVQQDDPGLTIPGLWVELNGDNTVKTFWIEDGV